MATSRSDRDAGGDLKSLPLPELEKKLGSSPDGLSQAEAQKRLDQYGPNALEEKQTNALLKFFSYFWGPIPWMIEAAVILSAVDRHWPDFFIILTVAGGQRVWSGSGKNTRQEMPSPRSKPNWRSRRGSNATVSG